MEENEMFEDVIVGDRLYSFEEGWGIVEDITDSDYPLIVQFKSKRVGFTIDGKRWKLSQNPTLFWDKIEFEVPKRPLPDLKVDTKVIVWASEEDTRKEKRYFKEFNKDGGIACFTHGATSWNAKGVVVWEHWELAGDNAEDIKKYRGE